MPISFRTDFKILLITVKALRVLAPEYILKLLFLYANQCTASDPWAETVYCSHRTLKDKRRPLFGEQLPRVQLASYLSQAILMLF